MTTDAPRRLHVAAVAVTVTSLFAGCTARVLAPSEGDAYRDEIRTLKDANAELTSRVIELERSLALATATEGPGPSGVPDFGVAWSAAEVAKEEPRAIDLAIGWGSMVERDAALPAATLTLYVEPRDARGRFVQVSGYLDVRVVAVRDPGKGESPTLAERRFGPSALRDAWRSGMFGTHYTLTMPVDLAPYPDVQAVAVIAVLYDGPDASRLAANATLDVTAPLK
ncbi:MAG: hypothetical protein JNM94_18415 [Phycisphaerae bacterium]|nr:hypothetical protein [Phycisphaerae bacterium]